MLPNDAAGARWFAARTIIWLSAALTFFILCVWAWTVVIDNLRLSVWQPWGLSVNIHTGRVDWERIYEFGGDVPAAQYWATPPPPPPQAHSVLGFSFSRGHQAGILNYEPGTDPNQGVVKLARYWRLAIPLGPILIFVVLPFCVWFISWYRRLRQNKVGFELISPERGSP
jgi:hypothetical protein